MRNKVLRASVLAGLAMMANGFAVASDALASFFDEDVDLVVTGTRVKMAKADIAADVSVIDQETIEKNNYTEVADALKDAGVDVSESAAQSYARLNGDSRVLVMVNGRRLNFDHLTVSGNDNATDLSQVPMENVERIEIVRGPNSSLYGQKAVGGVINIITKSGGQEPKTTVTAEYGSWAKRRGSIVTSGGDKDTQYMLSYTKEKRHNLHYKDANGNSHEFPDTFVNRDDITARFDHYFGNDRATLDFARSERKDGYGNYLTDALRGIPYNVEGTKYHSIITDLGLTYTFNQRNKGDGTFVRLGRIQDKTDSPFAGASYNHKLVGQTVEGQKAWDLGKHHLVAGTSWEEQHLQEENDGSGMDRKAITKAVFAEDRWDLGRGWSTNLGARYEHHSDFGGDWTGHVGLNKRISNDTHAYLSWGTAVNNPTLKMLYANTPYMQGNPDLNPEKSRTWTLGVESKINDKWSLDASLYHSKVKDALNWAWNGVTRYYNVDEEERRGLRIGAKYKANAAWTLTGAYEYSHIKRNGTWDGQNTTRPNAFMLGADYDMNKWHAGTTLSYVSGRDTTYYTDNDYFLWDANVSYKVSANTKVFAKFNNITNEHYETAAPWAAYKGAYAAPERNYSIGVSHTF